MEFSVWTNNKPCMLSFEIETKGKQLICIGYDPTCENTVLFDRLIIESGYYEFNMPQSPKKLQVIIIVGTDDSISDYNPENEKFIIRNVVIGKLQKQQLFVDADTKEFIDFAKDFCYKSGYSQPGHYYSKSGKFHINYLQGIEKTDDTPSRISVLTDIIDVSKNWFDGMTVPGRMAIVTHEFAHNHLDSNNEFADNKTIEKEADDNAREIYIGLGYPKVEWMYAWENIFQDHPDHIDRLVNSDNKLSIM